MEIKNVWKWIKDRVVERTSWDGTALIVAGVVVVLFGPWAHYAAYAAIVWGPYTLYKSERK